MTRGLDLCSFVPAISCLRLCVFASLRLRLCVFASASLRLCVCVSASLRLRFAACVSASCACILQLASLRLAPALCNLRLEHAPRLPGSLSFYNLRSASLRPRYAPRIPGVAQRPVAPWCCNFASLRLCNLRWYLRLHYTPRLPGVPSEPWHPSPSGRLEVYHRQGTTSPLGP